MTPRAFALGILLVLLLPLASAESFTGVRTVGAALGWKQGIVGGQVDDSGGGVRYWVNSTDEGDRVELLLTTCVATDARVLYCERHALRP